MGSVSTAVIGGAVSEEGHLLYRRPGALEGTRLAHPPAPKTVALLLTYRCNYKCCFCCNVGATSTETVMTLETAEAVLNALKRVGTIRVSYTGGEPLLHEGIVRIAKLGRVLGFQQRLVTNGSLLSASLWRDLRPPVDNIAISLHGLPETHAAMTRTQEPSFKRTMQRAEAVARDVSTFLLYTVTGMNCDKGDLTAMATFTKSIAARLYLAREVAVGGAAGQGTGLSLSPFVNFLHEVERLRRLKYPVDLTNAVPACILPQDLLQLSKGCGAGTGIAAVDPDANVKPCSTSQAVWGNMLQTPLEAIWSGEPFASTRDLGRWAALRCLVCRDLPRCRMGCHICQGRRRFDPPWPIWN